MATEPSLVCATASLGQTREIALRRSQLRSELAFVTAELNKRGYATLPSEANMLLVRVPDAAQAFDHLKRRGILIKNLSAQHPLLSQCLRITVGTPDENQALLTALAELWAPAPGV